ncbi:MAG: DUF4855 domain-containing protein [Syntrophomonadaceae bacterium]
MRKSIRSIYSDIAPGEGRNALTGFPEQNSPKQLNWTFDLSLGGETQWGQPGERVIKLSGSIEDAGAIGASIGWADLELSKREPVIGDLWLVGSRPLPQDDITCICRHPFNKAYLVAATAEAHLLLLDGAPQANLAILDRFKMDAAFSSLVCCGRRLLGLESPSGRCLYLIDVSSSGSKRPTFTQFGPIPLPHPLIALAENDAYSAWGLSASGMLYLIKVSEAPANGRRPAHPGVCLEPSGRLHRRRIITLGLAERVKGIYRFLKAHKLPRLKPGRGQGRFAGLAFDGENFWTLGRTEKLLMYNREWLLLRSFAARPEMSISGLSYTHNYLLVLDKEHQQLHHCYPADTLEPVASLSSGLISHPGYLPAGTAASGKIHDLCLLYTGGEGSSQIHRYDVEKLLPLAGYRSVQGEIKDSFMDGFLLLAQYSPLLNGRSFAPDLSGPPSRREDWTALFDEYFHPRANLSALDTCAREIERCLGRKQPLRVVLGIPTPDPRCCDWDDSGFSLAVESHRVSAVRWAFDELLGRWKKARFRRLILAGFYYLAEQGVLGDPVISIFPQLCRERGLVSFAIPGISSSYMTEFNRVGFDCVSLQSSHSFWKPMGRPRSYLLKSAGHIARDFGMGMEVELPYNVLEAEGAGKLRDYLDAARIQGWAGAFKSYFQSYNLVKSLADSQAPEYRNFYDELYELSRLSRRRQEHHHPYHQGLPVEWHGKWSGSGEKEYFRINIEGNQGVFRLTELAAEQTEK